MTPQVRSAKREVDARTELIRATAQIMLEEGYAAATSRRVATRAGVKPAQVHYYFPTMDDLYLAVFRRGAEANLERLKRALAAEQPLRALVDLSSERRGTQLQMEFMALANHRKQIRSEIAAYGVRFRDLETVALTMLLRVRGIELEQYPPVVVAVTLASVTRLLVLEDNLGVTTGHREAQHFLDRIVSELELRPPT